MATDQEIRAPGHEQKQAPRKWPWIVGIVVALIAGVGIGAAATGGDTEPTTTTEESAEIQELQDQIAGLEAERDEALEALAALTDEEQAEESEPEPAEEPEGAEYPLDVRWKDNGVTLAFDGIGFVSADSLAGTENEWVLSSDTQTLIVLTGSITNATGQAIEFYPDQGTLVVGNEQFDAYESMMSDLGGTVEDGVVMEGGIVFESTKPLTNYDGVTEVRFTADPAFDTRSFEDITGGVELTIPL